MLPVSFHRWEDTDAVLWRAFFLYYMVSMRELEKIPSKRNRPPKRNRPLNASMKALSVGLLGRLKSSSTLFR